MSDMRYALIPAYNPDDKLIEITHELVKYGLNKIAARWPAKAVAQFSTPK